MGRFNLVALLTLGAGITGGIVGYGLQLWSMSRWYPYLNVGGRPYNSWPYYLPITYELVILFAALTALIGMIVLNGLPAARTILSSTCPSSTARRRTASSW